jgi:hypothetical protein
VYTASVVAKHQFDALGAQLAPATGGSRRGDWAAAGDTAHLAVRVSTHPARARHASRHVRVPDAPHLKVGTTGTGGGLNIIHTPDNKPSDKLMTKTAIAFAHTGLMFLMARTYGGLTVKEVKPGAMVGRHHPPHHP